MEKTQTLKYMKHLKLFFLMVGWLTLFACQSNNRTEINNSTVKQLDISQFMGKWYEIARYNHFFECLAFFALPTNRTGSKNGTQQNTA